MSARTVSKHNLFQIASARTGTSFINKFWRLLMALYNLLPFGIFRCKSISDAKKHSIGLLSFLSVAFMPSLIIPMIATYATLKK